MKRLTKIYFLMREEGDGISASLYGIKDALRNRQTGENTKGRN